MLVNLAHKSIKSEMYFVKILSVLLKNWHISLYKLKAYSTMIWFTFFFCVCEMITMMGLANIHHLLIQ